MRIAIIIPAFNEENLIALTLESLVNQTFKATQIVVVDDNSTDNTFDVAQSFVDRLPLSVIKNQSSAVNVPGAKVVNAFKKGLELVDLEQVDLICKFDSDLIFPENYLEVITARFRSSAGFSVNSSEKIGMVAGHCTILKNGTWEIENLNNPDHIRGALKAYRVECFQQIGGLKSSIGWDTMDEMIARYFDWSVVTIPDLYVKHLKPTGAAYRPKSSQLQGEAFYKMRYGWFLTSITAMKMAWNKRQPQLVLDYVQGYLKAHKNGLKPLITEDQGRFLREYRWRGIRSKFNF